MSGQNNISLERAAAEHAVLARDIIDGLQKEADDKQGKIDELQKKVNELVQENGRKTASAERPKEVFNETDLRNTVNSLKELGYVDAAEIDKVAEDIQENPGRLLVFTDKIASMQKMPDMGIGVTVDDDGGSSNSRSREEIPASDRVWQKLFGK